jgi:two-component system chemotaxis response regulator CheY
MHALGPVLVVDDFKAMTAIMTRIVRQIGFETVETAQSAAEAFAKLQAGSFGLVICDLEMQPVSGLDFGARVRQEPKLKNVRLLLTTGHRDTLARAIADGYHGIVDGYILKPFTAEDLEAKLKEVKERMPVETA